jgi:hypothetical protein
MGGAHIARHFPAAGKVAPRGEHFDDAVRFLLPGKSVGAVRRFLAGGRRIEDGLDRLIEKMDGLVVIGQQS